jgi:hypothetical protein
MSPQEALKAYQDELAAAGVAPLQTTPLQEAILQALSFVSWYEENTA